MWSSVVIPTNDLSNSKIVAYFYNHGCQLSSNWFGQPADKLMNDCKLLQAIVQWSLTTFYGNHDEGRL